MKLLLSLCAALLLSVGMVAAGPPPVTVKKASGAIEFVTDDGLVARYHVGEDVPKPFFWPLNAPGGVPVTRGWPVQTGLPKETRDHVHQKSAWFCHGDVIPEGLELRVRSSDKRVKGVDFWSEAKGHGRIVCVSVGEPAPSASGARIATKNEWQAPDGTKILDEERTISVRNLGDARLVVLDIDLRASVCPITFGDTKEGSMGVRVNDQFALKMEGSDGVITSADGSTARAGAKDNLPMWGKGADWHDYSGTVDGKLVGIAIFDHPKNAPRAAWHTRAYGLLAANPFGRASFPGTRGGELTKLARGERLKLRYGLFVHKGGAADAKVAEHYAAFARE